MQNFFMLHIYIHWFLSESFDCLVLNLDLPLGYWKLLNSADADLRSQSQLRNDKYIMMQYTNLINSTPSQQ